VKVELGLRELWIDGELVGEIDGLAFYIEGEMPSEEIERFKNAEEICLAKKVAVKTKEVEKIVQKYLPGVRSEEVIREIFFCGYARGYRDRAEGK